MSPIFVFAASAIEGKPVRKLGGCADATSLRGGRNDVVLVTTGIGPRSARSRANEAIAAGGADAVLVIGLCGGLSACVPEGRIVAYSDCLTTEAASPSLACSPTLAKSIVARLESSRIPCDRVVGITSSRIATTRETRRTLAKRGAAVVDMESYAILEVAANADIPAAVLRVVADGFDRELPDFNRALNAAGSIDRRAALTIALRSPFRTASLLAANRRAMKRLSTALHVVL